MTGPARTDVAVIGAGPAALFAVFQLGLYGIRCHLVDILDRAGGQCAELYHDKPIYDIPGYQTILAGELVERLLAQIAPFKPVFSFDRLVTSVERDEAAGFRLALDDATTIEAQAVVIAAGAGAFLPRRATIRGVGAFEGAGVLYGISDPQAPREEDVVVMGGGDAALARAIELVPAARSVTLVHRRHGFRAAPARVEQLLTLRDEGRLAVRIAEVTEALGPQGKLSALRILDGDGVSEIACTRLIPLLGRTMELRPLGGCGPDFEANMLPVDAGTFETSSPGMFAIGDIVSYPGKLRLILSGFHEAALMAQAIKKRLRPKARTGLQYTTSSTDLQRKLGAI